MKKIISLLAALAVITAGSFSVMAADEAADAATTETVVEEVAETTDEAVEAEEAAEETETEEATEETEAEEATEETAEETEETEAVDYSAFDAEGIDVVVLGKKVEFDVQPEMQNDRVMVPVKAIFEALGAVVTWEDETQTVMAVKDNRVVLLQIGNTKMFVDDNEAIELDAPPILKDDSRTLVPVRAISEAFDYDVEWIEEAEMVVVSEKAAVEETETAEEETVIGEADAETEIVIDEEAAENESKEEIADEAEATEEATEEAEADEEVEPEIVADEEVTE